jgi:hypothetical protein
VGGQATWVRIDDFVQEIRDEPWSMYWTEWKSGTNEFQNFLLDPLNTMIADRIEAVSNSWSVNWAVCTILIVMPQEKQVKVLLFKHKA